MLGTILEVDEGRTSTNEPEKKKTIKMLKTLHTRDDMDRMYVSREEGGRGLTSINDSVYTSIKGLYDDIKKSKERLITATRNSSKTQGSIEQQ